jgi:hypothetical protein
VANTLQHAGIIRYGRGHIEILDRARLRKAACECYGAVKAHHDRLLVRPVRCEFAVAATRRA